MTGISKVQKAFHFILLIAVSVGSLSPLATFADRVEGVVSPTVKSFDVFNDKGEKIKTVNVTEAGEFTVYLKPGVYQVRSSQGEAIIRSEAKPMRNQRITFK